MMHRSDKTGFTLVELLIAVVIFAILGAISIPTFQSFLAQRRLNGAARELHANLMACRMQAVAENKWISTVINNNHQYTIFRDENKNGSVDTGEMILIKDLHPSYYDVTFDGAVIGYVVAFYPKGTGGSDGTLIINGSTGMKQITVSSNGRVRIN